MPTPLNEARIELKDRVVADFLSAGSALACLLPEALDFTIDRQAASATRLRWWHTGSPDNFYPPTQWVTYEGIPEAGKLPKNMNLSAIIHIDRETMDKELQIHGARPAVSYKYGTAIMAGYSSRHQILGLENEDASDYKVAMGIGEGPLIAGVGIVRRGGNSYHVSRVYTPLTKGISKGPVLPKAEIPSFIPSV